MENKLKLEHIAAYLPYELKVKSNRGPLYIMDIYSNMRGKGIEKRCIESVMNDDMKPILRPLSDMIKEVNYGLSSYIFIELFEIGDTDGFIYEFDSGNIKLLKQLVSISMHNNTYDINYLPYPVVQMMLEYHFDIFGLIDQGLAIDINTLNK